VRLPAARHQNAAVALLQQVLITQSAGRHTSASLLKIILSGVSSLKTTYLVAGLIVSNTALSDDFQSALVSAALERTHHSVRYDGSYYSIDYPGGDVPSHIGVCTDVVIRSYRALGTDLQRLVHEDISTHFNNYPSRRIWGLKRPDPNIDHRRVPILQTFFSRKGVSLPVTDSTDEYKAGDLVTWMLPGNLPHIGIVSDKVDAKSGTPLIVHNIGSGPVVENVLFDFVVTGHYRYVPDGYLGLGSAE
ncbi:MAG: DUF1287 domain-containing protein, partial [Candidatus Thiodiazotropha sp. 4PDIV1]